VAADGSFMSRTPSTLAPRRREQIVEAAIAVITEHGIQGLSLSAIEKKAGMARGQLTYYFKTKEDILLAVFDRILQRMHERVGHCAEHGACRGGPDSGWGWVELLLTMILTQPPPSPEFGCLQYTFLAQVSHREDFRQRLATVYELWRSNMAEGLAKDQLEHRFQRRVAPRALATLVQALLHGLSMQAVADPGAFDRGEMLHLCLDLLGTYLGVRAGASGKGPEQARPKATGRSNGQRRGLRRPVAGKR
jgi:AcrR family transcriptional regulator